MNPAGLTDDELDLALAALDNETGGTLGERTRRADAMRALDAEWDRRDCERLWEAS